MLRLGFLTMFFSYLLLDLASAAAVLPTWACTTGRITHYNYALPGGACGFTDFSGWDDFTVIGSFAMDNLHYQGGLECGQCYEVVSHTDKPYIVVVGDDCPPNFQPDDPCEGDLLHMDLAEYPGSTLTDDNFGRFADPALGYVLTSIRKVACPVAGPIRIHIDSQSNPSYSSFIVNNHKVGISKVQIKENGQSTWIDLRRESASWNSFNYSASHTIAYPIILRVWSIYNETVDVTVSSSRPDAYIDATGTPNQFSDPTIFPNSRTRCEAPFLPVMFDEVFDDGGVKHTQTHWESDAYTFVSQSFNSTPGNNSSYSYQATLQQFGGVTFQTNAGFKAYQVNSSSAFSFDIRGTNGYVGVYVFLNGDSNHIYNLPTLNGQWQHFDIPLTAFNASGFPANSSMYSVSWAVDTATTISLDNVLWHKLPTPYIFLQGPTSSPSLTSTQQTTPSPAGTPSTPTQAGIPSTPTPTKVGTPSTPTPAGTPSTPTKAGTPSSPTPTQAGTPSTPTPTKVGTPSTPTQAGTPSTPTQRGTPSAPTPSTPIPTTVGTASTPTQAGTPSTPTQAGTPSTPTPAGTTPTPTPTKVGTPSTPIQAGTPSTPIQAGTPSTPTQAGTPSTPVQAGTPSTPTITPTSASTPTPTSAQQGGTPTNTPVTQPVGTPTSTARTPTPTSAQGGTSTPTSTPTQQGGTPTPTSGLRTPQQVPPSQSAPTKTPTITTTDTSSVSLWGPVLLMSALFTASL